MKTMSKIYVILLTVLLLSAGAVGAASAADVLEPWEEEFLEEYGEYWMYEDYGSHWFEYFLYEANNEEYYNELLQKYEALAAENTVDNGLEPWEEEFLAEYGTTWMFEEYGSYWFEYYLYEGNDEEYYYELLQMYETLKLENAKETELPVETTTNTSVQNVTNTSVLNVTNSTVLNLTNTSTLNLTNTSTLNVTNTSVLNVTNSSTLNLTNTTIQNGTTLFPTQNTTNSSSLNVTVQGNDPESGLPVVPIIIGCVVAVILIAGVAVVLVKRNSTSSKEVPVSEEKPEVKPEEKKDVSVSEETAPVVVPTTPVPEAKAAVALTTPRECYTAVSSCVAEKYGVEHVASLTPRQLLAFGEPTAELKEFIRLYEQVRYAPNAGNEDAAKLSELAGIIIKQYSA